MVETQASFDNRVVYEQVAYKLSRHPQVKFLLVWNFKTPENIQDSFTRYKMGGGREVLAIFKSECFTGYSVIAVMGTPNFAKLPDLGFYPVRRDSANWSPRVWQADPHKDGWSAGEGRNYKNYELADNFRWVEFIDLVDIIRKDEAIALIYK
jgi:hypothetical protein